MGYSMGDKVKFRNYAGKPNFYGVYLVRIATSKKHHLKNDVIWEVRRTRISHPGLISESDIIRKISSNFEGFFQKQKP